MKIIILGAGGRGDVYARFGTMEGIEIAAVADINPNRLKKFSKAHNVLEDRLFTSWEEALEKEKYADAVVNALPDRDHFMPTMKALDKGYHVLLEKPMSPSEDECKKMVERAEEKGLILMVCHVLRYSPFFEKLKEVLDSGRIGEIVNLQLTENVVYWHFVHSFVRGIFRNEELSSPWILAKSCHDLDIIGYLTGKKCVSVVSEGSLMYYRKENAPEGAPDFCLDGCPHEKSCPHFAPAIYLKDMQNISWFTAKVSPDDSIKGRYEALQKGSFGKCAYKCDNNVTDHQSAIFQMEGGMTATFNMCGFSSENTRTLRVYGTKGDIRGHLEKGELEITDFLTMNKEVIKVDFTTIVSGHGGGDSRLMKDFIEVLKGKKGEVKSSARLSLQSHLMAFAAEKSRKEGIRVLI